MDVAVLPSTDSKKRLWREYKELKGGKSACMVPGCQQISKLSSQKEE